MEYQPNPELLDKTNGWLSPEGNFFLCEWHEHERFARQMGERYGSDLEKKGWIALRLCYWVYNSDERIKETVTQAQYDVIFDWMHTNEGRTLKLAFPAGGTYKPSVSYLKQIKVE
jgi:hypothetical protein